MRKIGISADDNTLTKDVVLEETIDLEHTAYPHIFVTGDAADAFGAIPAGHNAYAQVTCTSLLLFLLQFWLTRCFRRSVAARNIVRLINSSASKKNEAEASALERYTPKPPAIEVSIGLVCLYSLILIPPYSVLFSSSFLLSFSFMSESRAHEGYANRTSSYTR